MKRKTIYLDGLQHDRFMDDCAHNNGKSFSYSSDYFEISIYVSIFLPTEKEVNTKQGSRHAIFNHLFFLGYIVFFFIRKYSFIRKFMSRLITNLKASL